MYEQLRNAWQVHQKQQQERCVPVLMPPTTSSLGELGPKLLMGLAAGATGQMVAVPADLIKVESPDFESCCLKLINSDSNHRFPKEELCNFTGSPPG